MTKNKNINEIDRFAPFEGELIYQELLCGRKYDQNTYEHYIIGKPESGLTLDDFLITISKDLPQNIVSPSDVKLTMPRHELILYIDYRLSEIYGLFKTISPFIAKDALPARLMYRMYYCTHDVVLNMHKFIELFLHHQSPFTKAIKDKYKSKFGETGNFIRECSNAFKHTAANLTETSSLIGEGMPTINAVYEPRKPEKITIKKYTATLPAVVIAFRDIFEYIWFDKPCKYKHKISSTKSESVKFEYMKGTDDFFIDN